MINLEKKKYNKVKTAYNSLINLYKYNLYKYSLEINNKKNMLFFLYIGIFNKYINNILFDILNYNKFVNSGYIIKNNNRSFNIIKYENIIFIDNYKIILKLLEVLISDDVKNNIIINKIKIDKVFYSVYTIYKIYLKLKLKIKNIINKTTNQNSDFI
jgi:hypothetical protein